MELSDYGNLPEGCLELMLEEEKEKLKSVQRKVMLMERALRAYTIICDLLDFSDMQDVEEFKKDIYNHIFNPDYVIETYFHEPAPVVVAIVRMAMYTGDLG